MPAGFPFLGAGWRRIERRNKAIPFHGNPRTLIQERNHRGAFRSSNAKRFFAPNSPTRIAIATAGMQPAGDEIVETLIFRARMRALKILEKDVRTVGARGSRNCTDELCPATISERSGAQSKFAALTSRLRLQRLVCKARLRFALSLNGLRIRQRQICRLRLAPASGISALPELWPSG
jgi:hypothetical protein